MDSTARMVDGLVTFLSGQGTPFSDRKYFEKALRLAYSRDLLAVMAVRYADVYSRALAMGIDVAREAAARKVLPPVEERKVLTRAACLALIAGVRPSEDDCRTYRNSVSVSSSALVLNIFNIFLGIGVATLGLVWLLTSELSAWLSKNPLGAVLVMLVGATLTASALLQTGNLRTRLRLSRRLALVVREVARGADPRALLSESGEFAIPSR